MSRPKIILIVGVIIILVISAFVVSNKNSEAYLTLGNTKIKVELADTSAKQAQGLSGHESLDQDSGMLFIFDQPGHYGFWMKDMYFAIDMIWLDSDWRVVSISQNISPSTYPTAFYPATPAQYVLEVKANWATQNNVATGTKATYGPGNEVPTI